MSVTTHSSCIRQCFHSKANQLHQVNNAVICEHCVEFCTYWTLEIVYRLFGGLALTPGRAMVDAVYWCFLSASLAAKVAYRRKKIEQSVIVIHCSISSFFILSKLCDSPHIRTCRSLASTRDFEVRQENLKYFYR